MARCETWSDAQQSRSCWVQSEIIGYPCRRRVDRKSGDDSRHARDMIDDSRSRQWAGQAARLATRRTPRRAATCNRLRIVAIHGTVLRWSCTRGMKPGPE